MEHLTNRFGSIHLLPDCKVRPFATSETSIFSHWLTALGMTTMVSAYFSWQALLHASENKTSARP